MSNIKISIGDYISEQPKRFNKELKELSDYYRNNVKKDINGIVEVLSLLSKDNEIGGDSAEFIKKILSLHEQKRQWREK